MSVSKALPPAAETAGRALPGFGGCMWPADFGVRTAEWEAQPEHQRDIGLEMATRTLQRLVGYRVGVCPIKLRPCLSPPSARAQQAFLAYDGPGFYPVNLGGVWSNVCHCGGPCSCGTSCEIALPAPVGRIDEVRVDGVVIPEADYAIQNGHILVWRGTGDCPWVLGQDMSKADTEPGTMSITYLNAYPVDAAGAYAVGVLAWQFAAAYSGKGNCYLPKNVTQMVRNGVAMEIISGAFPNGLTGLKEVDAYIGMWNPGRLRQAPTIYSPDSPQHRVDTLLDPPAPFDDFILDGGGP